jgi:DNA invertase Pin-like site-specific DNA recombinase
MTIRAAIYARASADCPVSIESQIERLKAFAAEHCWEVVRTFRDSPTSMKKAREKRPGETALIDVIRARAIDKVLVWSVCRIGKSLVDLVPLHSDFDWLNVRWLQRRQVGTIEHDSDTPRHPRSA